MANNRLLSMVLLSLVAVLFMVDVSHCNHTSSHTTDIRRPFHSPVRIELYSTRYCEIAVGVPSVQARFLVDMNSNYVILGGPPKTTSMSYVIEDLNGEDVVGDEDEDIYAHGSEVMTFGLHHRIRMELAYGDFLSPTSLYVVMYQHDGILGLGVKSPVWKYWTKATLSGHSIVLGAEVFREVKPKSSVVRIPFGDHLLVTTKVSNKAIKDSKRSWKRAARLKKNIDLAEQEGWNESRVYKITIDYGTETTTLPPSLYYIRSLTFTSVHSGECIKKNNGECKEDSHDSKLSFSFETDAYSVVDSVGTPRSTLRKGEDPDLIVLGFWTLTKMVVTYDMIQGTWALMPGYDMFDEKLSSAPSFFSVVRSVTSLAVFVWIFCCMGYNRTVVPNLRLSRNLLAFKTAISIMCAVSTLTHSYGYNGSRLLSRALHRDSHVEYTTVVWCQVALSVVDVVIAVASLNKISEIEETEYGGYTDNMNEKKKKNDDYLTTPNNNNNDDGSKKSIAISIGLSATGRGGLYNTFVSGCATEKDVWDFIIPANRLIFESNCFLTVWLCALEFQGSLVGGMGLVVFSSVLAIVCCIRWIKSVVYRGFLDPSSLVGLAWVLFSGWHLVSWNFVPFYMEYSIMDVTTYTTTYIMTFLLVGIVFPITYFYTRTEHRTFMNELLWLKRDLSLLKKNSLDAQVLSKKKRP